MGFRRRDSGEGSDWAAQRRAGQIPGRQPNTISYPMPRPLRIGVNALYLIPGGVGGSEIYLRNLLSALSATDETSTTFSRITKPAVI